MVILPVAGGGAPPPFPVPVPAWLSVDDVIVVVTVPVSASLPASSVLSPASPFSLFPFPFFRHPRLMTLGSEGSVPSVMDGARLDSRNRRDAASLSDDPRGGIIGRITAADSRGLGGAFTRGPAKLVAES